MASTEAAAAVVSDGSCRPPAVISFAVFGHVDTGKSTLCGHLLVQTGGIPAADFEAIRRRAEKDGALYGLYSRVFDIYEEEMLKSKTHECARAPFDSAGQSYVLVDTPGHKGFIRAMIEGITRERVSVGVLVVSAKAGEFEAAFDRAGQTREHAILARASGIRRLVVCVNKMDTVGWSAARFHDIKQRLGKFLATLSLDLVAWVPTSGYGGVGLLDTTSSGSSGLPQQATTPHDQPALASEPMGRTDAIGYFGATGNVDHKNHKDHKDHKDKDKDATIRPTEGLLTAIRRLAGPGVHGSQEQSVPITITVSSSTSLEATRSSARAPTGHGPSEQPQPDRMAIVAAVGQLTVLAPEALVTSGFRAVAHIAGHEVDTEIECAGMLRARKNQNKGRVTWHFAVPVTAGRGDHVLLRSGESTIGFGVIERIKPLKTASTGGH